MKFVGIPATASHPQVITAFDDQGRGTVLKGDFAWGKPPKSGCGNLAKAILTTYLGNPAEAVRLHTRFLWRTVKTWPEEKGWTLTSEDIEAVLADIREGDKLVSGIQSRVSMEPAPAVTEAGRAGERISPVENKG